MREFRIAVCFSGEPRTWEIAHENISSFFAIDHIPYLREPHTVVVDAFVHTWTGNTWRRNGEWAHELLSSDEIEKIKATYSPIGFRVDQAEKAKTVWGSLFKSQMLSFHLKRKHEIASGFEYDLVIKARLDTIYPPGEKFNVHRMQAMNAYTTSPMWRTPREYFATNFNEVIYYADSPTMDLIGDVERKAKVDCDWGHYDRVIATGHEHPQIKYGPGAYMYRYMVEHHIHPTHAPVLLEYAIVREEAVKRGLNGVLDYNEIKHIHDNFYS